VRIPRVGLVICNSWSSNSGYITGLAATRLLTEFGDDVGICSSPAIANKVSKILDQLDIHYDEHINLENLGIRKLGPFTALKYDREDLEKVYRALTSRVKNLLNRSGEAP